MYKKGPCNVHADALSPLTTLDRTTADDWDKMSSIFLSNQASAHTDFRHKENHFIPRELRYKPACKNTQLERNDSPCDATCFDDKTRDDLFAAFLSPTPADSIPDSILEGKLPAEQLHDAFCVDIPRRPTEGVMLPFEDEKKNFMPSSDVQSNRYLSRFTKGVRYIHHDASFAGHPGERVLYQSTR